MTDRRRAALYRYFLQRALICLIEGDRRRYDEQNASIRHATAKVEEQIDNFKEKLLHLHQLNALIELPLEDYFQQRMERLRISAERHMAAFDAELQHEIEHWKNIHSVLSQPWIEPGLLRSDYGALPRTIQRRPAGRIETIEEENELQRPSRSLAMINRFSILSNGEHRRKRLNKTFVKIPSQRNDENAVALPRKSSSIICLD